MTTLLVFARTPVPGQVKTRLMPALDAGQACALYVRLVERTLQLCRNSGFAATQLWLSDPPEDNPHCQRWLRRWPCVLRLQQGVDLGARMEHALGTVLGPGSAAVLIGCDVGGLLRSDLIEAGEALESGCDAVLGACEDGGYYLLGLQRPCPELFRGMNWGGGEVAGETLRRLRGDGRRVHQLAVRWDVDRAGDLHRLDCLDWHDGQCSEGSASGAHRAADGPDPASARGRDVQL